MLRRPFAIFARLSFALAMMAVATSVQAYGQYWDGNSMDYCDGVYVSPTSPGFWGECYMYADSVYGPVGEVHGTAFVATGVAAQSASATNIMQESYMDIEVTATIIAGGEGFSQTLSCHFEYGCEIIGEGIDVYPYFRAYIY